MKSYYFDYNATTPLDAEVFKEMEPFFSRQFGNPSSLHHTGRAAAKALREARRKVAAILDAAEENEIIFTSGGTESNNAAIRSALCRDPDKRQVVTSAVEHSSVRKLCRQLAKEGYMIREVGVDPDGRLNLDELERALTDHTAVVSLMMANNETGVLFPIEEIGKKVKERKILFHVDAVQTVGKISLSLAASAIDFLSLSGHKFYGPKGTGVLYARSGAPFRSLIFGGAQERGRRAGTENVPGFVGLGAAAEMAHKVFEKEGRDLARLRDEFETEVSRQISGVHINGKKSPRISNTSNLRFRNVDGEALLINLDQRGICVSNGSACLSGSREPSHVLKAMGLSDEEANSAIRFSFGRHTTAEEIGFLIIQLKEAVAHLRKVTLANQHSHS